MKTKPPGIDPLAIDPIADRYARAQLIILDGLRDAIRRGGEAGLKPLVWTLGFGGVTGAIDNLTHGTEKALALYEAWFAVLGAERIADFPRNEHGDMTSTAKVQLPDRLALVLKLKLLGDVIENEAAREAARAANQEGA